MLRAASDDPELVQDHDLARLAIGDLVTFRGRAFFVRGFSPASLGEPHLELQDPGTDEWITAPVTEVDAATDEMPSLDSREQALRARLRRTHRPFGTARSRGRWGPAPEEPAE